MGLFAESVVLETNVLGRGLAAKVFMGLAPGFPVGVVGTLSLALLALALVGCAGRGGSPSIPTGNNGAAGQECCLQEEGSGRRGMLRHS